MLKWNRTIKKALKASFCHTCEFTVCAVAIVAWFLGFGYSWTNDHYLLVGVFILVAIWAIWFMIELFSEPISNPCAHADKCTQYQGKD